MHDPLYVAIRFALYANLMLVFGLPLFALYTPEARNGLALGRPASIALTGSGLALSALSMAALTASMAGVPIASLDLESLTAMISGTSIGAAWSVRMAALCALILGDLVLGSRSVAVALGGLALGSLAWTGHGAAGEGSAGTLQLIADLVHLFAAAAWFGALVGLGGMIFGRSTVPAAQRALDRFSTFGTAIVIALLASGLVNGLYLVGWQNLGGLPATLYGQLLIAKLVLFTVMLGCAALNRFRLTPALDRTRDATAPRAMRALRRSLVLETGAATAILAIVAWLGTLAPTGVAS